MMLHKESLINHQVRHSFTLEINTRQHVKLDPRVCKQETLSSGIPAPKKHIMPGQQQIYRL